MIDKQRAKTIALFIVLIAFEYAAVFSLLSLSFTVLLLKVGKVAEGMAEPKLPDEQGSHKDWSEGLSKRGDIYERDSRR